MRTLKNAPSELKERITNEAIALYLEGFKVIDVSDIIRNRYGVGSGYVYRLLTHLPREVKDKHIEVMLNKLYYDFVDKYGEEKAKKRLEVIRKLINIRVK